MQLPRLGAHIKRLLREFDAYDLDVKAACASRRKVKLQERRARLLANASLKFCSAAEPGIL